MPSNGKFPLALLSAYMVFFAVLAVNPIHRGIWLAENITVWFIVVPLVIFWVRGVRFSNLAYALMAVLIFMHTFGGHYSFSKVPFDWFTDFFGFERNHYDRVAHFAVGFYAFAVAEWLHTKRLVANRFLLFTYAIFFIAMIAMTYEIVEWIAVISSNPVAGAEYLGSQGDIWDAQKDMLMNTLGAISAVIIYFFLRKPTKDLT